MPGAYNGVILDIDLTHERIEEKKLNESIAKLFIGGKGLGTYYLIKELRPKADPLGPDNIFILATGPLTGTLAPSSGRWAVVTKSPLTEIYLDSQVGGFFGAYLKHVGYDLVLIRGKANFPVYIYIDKEHVEIEDASNLWGSGCFETEKILKEKYGKDVSVGSIGPAGEKMVKFATITFDRGRQAGRGGTGAVWGSKNLKAIVIKKAKAKIEYAYPEKFREAVKKAINKINSHPFIPIRKLYGTPTWVDRISLAGLLPTRNFQNGSFENVDKICATTMRLKIVNRDMACFGCPVSCWKYSKVKDGKYAGTEVIGPEYETIALMGSNCGINSIEAIAYANALADDLGLDTISTGVVIAWAMECYEKGIIGKEDTENLELTFGNEKVWIEIIRKIAYREGLGDTLAEGVWRASKKIGKGSENLAPHVKGMEIPGYDPRGSFGMALAYSTSDRGACHQRAWTVKIETYGMLGPRFSYKNRAKIVKEIQDERAVCFSLVLCDFMPLNPPDFVEMLNNATGFNYTIDEYLKVGERIWNLARLFSIREKGISRKDDYLPPRFYEEILPSTGYYISKEEFNKMLDEYYKLRGWNENGIPTKEKLKELQLDKFVNHI